MEKAVASTLGQVEMMPIEREVTFIYKWKPFASRPI
jgi:hypothetical protein